MDNEWISLQIKKYAGKNFGESTLVVERKCIEYEILLEYAKPGLTFLDIGCNDGRVVYEMVQRGLIAKGADLPQIISKIKYKIETVPINLEEEFPEGSFDIIYCRETLEHLHNYEETAQKIIKALSPSGIAIIACPYDSRDDKRNCPEHVRIFEESSVKNMMIKCGAKIIKEFTNHKKRGYGRSRGVVCCRKS